MVNRVVLVGYDGAEGLDLFGPAEVFTAATVGLGAPAYDVVFAAVGGGSIALTSGASVSTRALGALRPRADDTVLVVGGEDGALERAASSDALMRWLLRAAPVVRRLGSVCDGAFILARAGILDGRRAATHWSSCDRLAGLHGRVEVDREAIFVRDGTVWTSAGVTTGIDMALAMVEEDHGRRLADTVAAHLVVYARRPGFQSQFSEVLVAQSSASDPLGPLLAWVRANLRTSLDVTRLARRAGMSVRSLHRRCGESLSTTPAKLVEKLRVEQARTLLATTDLGTKTIAARCGFGTARRMAPVFERVLGVSPRTYRTMFTGADPGAGDTPARPTRATRESREPPRKSSRPSVTSAIGRP
jgi:transcriptional regulator GlxA family with amidase domain